MLRPTAVPFQPTQTHNVQTDNVQTRSTQNHPAQAVSAQAYPSQGYRAQLYPGGRPPQSRELSHLPAPFVRHRWIQNPCNDTWFTEGECSLVCAIIIHVRRVGTAIANFPYIYPYTYSMINEILQMIRNALPVPWNYLALNCFELHMWIRDHPDRAIRRLWYAARYVEGDFWEARARWAFELWAITDSPLAQQLWHTRELAKYYSKRAPGRLIICPRIFDGPIIPTMEHPGNTFSSPALPQVTRPDDDDDSTAPRTVPATTPVTLVNPRELPNRSVQIRRQIDELLGRKAEVERRLSKSSHLSSSATTGSTNR
ncbi:hypothetical protein N7G274_000866 [Stereocaulon virgatum]|uniref:Uncharacterized protein n=1 Tax=Stereocaulon virgatum TaxID=373712 RepID=A0ABR4AP08_9LECA